MYGVQAYTSMAREENSNHVSTKEASGLLMRASGDFGQPDDGRPSGGFGCCIAESKICDFDWYRLYSQMGPGPGRRPSMRATRARRARKDTTRNGRRHENTTHSRCHRVVNSHVRVPAHRELEYACAADCAEGLAHRDIE